MEIEKGLLDLGLNPKEAIVYLTTLKEGVSKVSLIAQNSKLNREATYYILKTLEEKGFVSEMIRSGVKYYSPLKPSEIKKLIEEEKRMKFQTLQEILPELDNLTNNSMEIPKIELIEGNKGVKRIMSEILEQGTKNIYCYFSKELFDIIPFFRTWFTHKRKEKKINLFGITRDSDIKEDLRTNKKELRDVRYNKSLFENNNLATYILEDQLVIIKFENEEIFGLKIKDRTVARFNKNIFDNLWKISKK